MEKINFINNQQPALNAANLNRMQDNVEDLIKTESTNSDTDTYSCNYINSMNKYSTNEVKTNKVWIDGKPIYRKVINTTLGSDGNWNTIINDNIKEVINLFGSFNVTGQRYVIPRSYDGQSVTFYWQDGALYEIHNYAYANNRDAIIIIEYTKTTD